MHRILSTVALGAVLLAAAPVAHAQAAINVAVIDVERVVRDSDPGKAAIEQLRKESEALLQRGQSMQQELQQLQEQAQKQQMTLSAEKLEEMQKQMEDKAIALQRFEEDARRQLEEMQRETLSGLEGEILEIVDSVGREKGIKMIFKKFQSGLVYADTSVDITDEIIRRYNLAN